MSLAKRAREEAEKEFQEEKFKGAKSKIKEKLKQLDKAKKIVSNIERELEDLYVEIADE
ncbi:MAG: hypothetical protein ACW98X_27755 [Promethearchaeota archaeon]